MKIHSEKVREGTLAHINLSSNPQKYSNTVWGTVKSIIGTDTFESKDYGIGTFLKVNFKSRHTKQRVGYLEEVIEF